MNSSANGDSAGSLVRLLLRRIVVLKSSALCIFSIFALRTITQLRRCLHLFQTIKAEYQSIRKAFVISDNAGCYDNGPLLLCLHEVAKNVGVNLIRYDFSEPQAGKGICDRKTAPMKAHIRRFVNENNDVTTAEEMKKALESHGGLRG